MLPQVMLPVFDFAARPWYEPYLWPAAGVLAVSVVLCLFLVIIFSDSR